MKVDRKRGMESNQVGAWSKAKESRCPFCGSDNVEANDSLDDIEDIECGSAYFGRHCAACK